MSEPQGFEAYVKPENDRSALGQEITIMKDGTIGISGESHGLINRDRRVEFLFNRDRSVLAIRAAGDSPNGYKTSRPLKSGYTTVYARPFLQKYGVKLGTTIRLAAWLENDLLCADVSELIA